MKRALWSLCILLVPDYSLNTWKDYENPWKGTIICSVDAYKLCFSEVSDKCPSVWLCGCFISSHPGTFALCVLCAYWIKLLKCFSHKMLPFRIIFLLFLFLNLRFTTRTYKSHHTFSLIHTACLSWCRWIFNTHFQICMSKCYWCTYSSPLAKAPGISYSTRNI